jgi:hypothetical protein
MSKPSTLKDLLVGQHISLREVEDIARTVFDGETTAAGPEGYVITACRYDDLPDHIQQFVRKAFLSFTVENVLDVDHSNADSVLADEDPDEDDAED